MRRILLVLGTFLVMTGSAYGFDLERVCGDFATLRSPDTKVYRGESQRTYPSGRSPQEAALVLVETTERGRVLLFYVLEGFRSRKPRCYPMFGSMGGGILTVRLPWVRRTLQYTFDGNGGATGQFVTKDKGGTVIFEAAFKLRLEK